MMIESFLLGESSKPLYFASRFRENRGCKQRAFIW